MACCNDTCCASTSSPKDLNTPRWRRALWIALVINAGFFVAEIVAGAAAGSASLQADALDFFGDAANYAISLGVAGMVLAWRARAAVVKGWTLLAFALWVRQHGLARVVRNASAGRSDGHNRSRRPRGQRWRCADALPLPHRGREHALGVDLFQE